MFHKVLITVLVCFTALRTDFPHIWAASPPNEAVISTNNDWDEHECPTDESEFPDADDWEVVETESKAEDHGYYSGDLTVCVRLGGSSLCRESSSLSHFSLGSFDILDRLRL